VEPDGAVDGTMETGTCAVHQEYVELFQALGRAGVAYCLLRPAEELPALEKDLDLLVDPTRRRSALGAIKGCGFRLLKTERHNPRKIVLVKWTDEGAAYIDLHLAVINQGLEYLDPAGALARRVEVNGLPQLAPADMAVVLIVHDLLGKKRLQPKYRTAIEAGLPALPGSEAQRELARFGIADLVPDTAAKLAPYYDDPEATERLAADVSRMLVRRNPRMRFRRMWMRVKRVFSAPSRGVSVCFLGPDGSGKSTTLEEFSRLVRDELRWNVSGHYMGPWGDYHFPRLRNFIDDRVPAPLGRVLAERREAIARMNGRARPSFLRSISYEWRRFRGRLPADEVEFREFQRATSWAWIAFLFVRDRIRYAVFLLGLYFELWWRYARVWRCKRRGRLVIMDRYIYDFITGRMHSIEPHYRWARTLMCALYPRPDRIFLLHAPAEVIVRRKKDLDLERARQMQAFYAALGKRWKMTVVSTEDPPKKVARGILEREFDWLVEHRRR
jgi:thymidylate kinase